MGKKKKTQENEAASTESAQMTTAEGEQKGPTYVVLRDGFRVEDREYDSPKDPAAVATAEFWRKVSNNHSWGEKVEIVQYDAKKHRVW